MINTIGLKIFLGVCVIIKTLCQFAIVHEANPLTQTVVKDGSHVVKKIQ